MKNVLSKGVKFSFMQTHRGEQWVQKLCTAMQQQHTAESKEVAAFEDDRTVNSFQLHHQKVLRES